MKILQIEINKIRGIQNLKLQPGGKNLVIFGPNGTGKSGVIDAIDFLLTGKISRLLGQGTKSLNLKNHGVHIDADSKESFVKATVQIDEIDGDITLVRNMKTPNTLKIEGCSKEELNPILEVAVRGQHILSRKELLKFVTAEPKTRSETLQTLLNIFEIEKTRKNLVKIAGLKSKKVAELETAKLHAQTMVTSFIEEEEFEDKKLLNFINENRKALNTKPISELASSQIKSNIEFKKQEKGTVNYELLAKYNNHILNVDQNSEKLKDTYNGIISTVIQIKQDPNKFKAFKRQSFLKLGYTILEEENDNDCPFCEKTWKENELKEYVENKLKESKELDSIINSLNKDLEYLQKGTLIVSNAVHEILKLGKPLKAIKEKQSDLNKWASTISKFTQSLHKPITNLEEFKIGQLSVNSLFCHFNLKDYFKTREIEFKAGIPKVSNKDKAWDNLTTIETQIKSLEKAGENLLIGKKEFERAVLLNKEYEVARDRILNELYNSIQKKFSNLYVKLHGEDEQNFEAELNPSGAALNFEVDFYGRGKHPPNALHSEGHQDSMGLCIFLALSEFLAKGIIDIVLLDDVVMSVDAEHRRSLCSLLKESFPSNQFIITTHDKTWCNQLRTEGVVSSKNVLEFFKWDLETGPYSNKSNTLIESIDKLLGENNIPSAAANLRRESEKFFETMCELLEATVPYRASGRYDLGVLMPNAFAKFKKLLKEAKASANSWNNQELMVKIDEYLSIASQVYQRTKAEEWGINASVHFNSWANLNKNDFEPIKEAMFDLFNIFICSNCKGEVRLLKNGFKPESMKCPCGELNYNLIKK